MNNNAIIRQAAIDLYSLDYKNVVKVAGVVRTIVNWLKGFGDPEFQQQLKELERISPEIKRTIDALSVEIGKLQKAISNTDPEQFGQALEAVRPLVSELSGDLSSLDEAAAKTKAEAPVDAIVNSEGEVISGDDIRRLDRGWKKDTRLVESMKSLLPESLDVPVQSHINKPVQEFEWFRQFGPEHIRFSKNSEQWVVDEIAKLIFDSGDLDSQSQNNLINFLNRNKEFIVYNLKDKILQGTLRSYTFPSEGQPNKMTVVIDAGTVKIPGLDFEVQFPTIFLHDRFASISPIKELDVVSIKNVRAYSPYEEKNMDLDEGNLYSVLEKNNWNIAGAARELGMSDRSLRRKMQDMNVQKPQSEVQQEQVQEPLVQEPKSPQEQQEEVQEEPLDKILDEKEIIAKRVDELIKLAEQLDYMDFANQKMGNRHEWARAVIQSAFYKVMKRMPTDSEIQAVQAVAHLESSYGFGWKGPGVGSNNWGAIQCSSCKVNGRCDPSISFEYKDSSPQSDGTTKWYVMCYKKYATPEDGAADLIKTLFLSKAKNIKGDSSKTRGELLQEAVSSGDLRQFSEAMYDTVYYEGTGKDKETRISRHMGALQRALNDMNKSTGREIAMMPGGSNMSSQTQQVAQQSTIQEQVPMIDKKQEILNGQDAQQLFNFLFASGPIEKIVKRALYKKILPTTRLLITIGSSEIPFHTRVRFAKILSSALRIELDAESSIHNYGDKIEIESDICGSQENVVRAAKGMCEGISEAFELATENRGDYKVSTRVFSNTKSAYALIDSGIMETCFRKFAFDMVSK